MVLVSCVSSVRDESGSIAELVDRVGGALGSGSWEHEVVLVDDASSDGTWAAIEAAARTDPRVRGVRLGRRAGALEAIAIGLATARGDVVCVTEGDLESRPEELPALVALVLEGTDLVTGARQDHGDRPIDRRLASRTLRTVMWFHPHRPSDYGSGCKAMSRSLLERVIADPTSGTGPHWTMTLLDRATSYRELPIPYVDRQHRSRFSVRSLAFNLSVYAGSVLRQRAAPVRRAGAMTAVLGIVGLASPRRRRRAEAALALAAASTVVLGAGWLARRSRPHGVPGSTAMVVERTGSADGPTGGLAARSAAPTTPG